MENVIPPPTNNPPVLPTTCHAKVVQELNELQAISTYIDYRLENIDQFLNDFTQPPNEIDMDDLDPDDESVVHYLAINSFDGDDLAFQCMIDFRKFVTYFDPFLSMNIITCKAYNTIVVEGLESIGKNLVSIVRDVYVFVGSFTYITDFVILEDIGEFILGDMAKVVMVKPFRKVTKLKYDCAKGLMSFTGIFDNYTFQMPRNIPSLYLMRRRLEVLRKFHMMILRGRFNQLSHVSSPLLSKPGNGGGLILYQAYGNLYAMTGGRGGGGGVIVPPVNQICATGLSPLSFKMVDRRLKVSAFAGKQGMIPHTKNMRFDTAALDRMMCTWQLAVGRRNNFKSLLLHVEISTRISILEGKNYEGGCGSVTWHAAEKAKEGGKGTMEWAKEKTKKGWDATKVKAVKGLEDAKDAMGKKCDEAAISSDRGLYDDDYYYA
ncbi:hypothetical protein Tco_0490395 [Tanacetum coccineum]